MLTSFKVLLKLTGISLYVCQLMTFLKNGRALSFYLTSFSSKWWTLSSYHSPTLRYSQVNTTQSFFTTIVYEFLLLCKHRQMNGYAYKIWLKVTGRPFFISYLVDKNYSKVYRFFTLSLISTWTLYSVILFAYFCVSGSKQFESFYSGPIFRVIESSK